MFPNLTTQAIDNAKREVAGLAQKISVTSGNEALRTLIHDMMSLLRNYYATNHSDVTYKTLPNLADMFTSRSLRAEFPKYADVCTAVANNLLK